MRLALAPFQNAPTIWLMVVIVLAAIASKLIGGALGAISLGRKDALRVGVGMIPRGEVGLIVAQIGFTLSVISKDTYGIVVFMSLATTLVAPPLLAAAFRGVDTQEPAEPVPQIVE